MSDHPNNYEVRDWAIKRDPTLSLRGSLPRYVIAAWDRAHPDRPYKATEAYHGTTTGYFDRDCRCDRCKQAGSDESHTRYVHARDFGGDA